MTRRPLALALALTFAAGCGAPEATGADDAPADDLAADGAGCAPAVAAFTVDRAHAAGPAFVGYGAQFNQNLYAAPTRAAGIDAKNVGRLEDKVVAMAPAHVRVFFDARAFSDDDLMQSFVRTVELAQRAGATVNVTYWHGPYPSPDAQMKAFAAVLAKLVRDDGLPAARYVTIQNEVNSTKITMAEYAALWRALDRNLRALDLRDHFTFVGGDLLAEDQAAWFHFMATHLADVLDGYSVHIYWDYRDTAKPAARLAEVRALVRALPPAGRKPLYVTEFGVRGDRTGGADPGTLAGGLPVEKSITSALEHARFDLLAARLGYVATVKWDAYFAMYDGHPQDYSTIGRPEEGFPLRPSYHLTRMLAHTVDPGMHAVAVAGASPGVLVSAFAGDGKTTVLALNDGACAKTLRLDGLPAGRALYHVVWNGDGAGALKALPRVETGGGRAEVTLPPHSVVSLSTALPGLGL